MSRFFALMRNDFKHIFRDKALTALFVMPLFLVLALRFGFPHLVSRFPIVAGYNRILLAFVCGMFSAFPAFIAAFIMLDEKDDGLFTVLRVMPISPMAFILYRMSFVVALGSLSAGGAMLFSGIIAPDVGRALVSAVLFGLSAPLIALLVVTIAKNKIEGVTVLKGLNLLLMLPLISFFTSSPARLLLGVIPVYWVYQAEAEPVFSASVLASWAVAAALDAIGLTLLYRWFRMKVF
jgi:fluoroquinolone transport system permease protein